jgi:hypothetical protein
MEIFVVLVSIVLSGAVLLAAGAFQRRRRRSAWPMILGALLMAAGLAALYATGRRQPPALTQISLQCNLDTRTVAPNKTVLGTVPPYVLYVSETGEQALRVGEPPPHDPSDSALVQLGDRSQFMHCRITNGLPQPLKDVAVSFATKFTNDPKPSEATVRADSINGNGGSFEFAIANFAKRDVTITGGSLTTAEFSTSIDKVDLDPRTLSMLALGIPLPPQRRKATPWIFPKDTACLSQPSPQCAAK